jgi:hypothetical protein
VAAGMTCRECGADTTGLRFCGSCGTPVADTLNLRTRRGTHPGRERSRTQLRRVMVATLTLITIAGLIAFAGIGPTSVPPSSETTRIPVAAEATPIPVTHSLIGTLTLRDGYTGGGCCVGGGWIPCSGSGGYSDITSGAPVTVRDANSTIIAAGRLRGSMEFLTASPESGPGCVFDFRVDNVPDTAFYVVEVTHRGGLTYSREDLIQKGWAVAVFLGR